MTNYFYTIVLSLRWVSNHWSLKTFSQMLNQNHPRILHICKCSTPLNHRDLISKISPVQYIFQVPLYQGFHPPPTKMVCTNPPDPLAQIPYYSVVRWCRQATSAAQKNHFVIHQWWWCFSVSVIFHFDVLRQPISCSNVVKRRQGLLNSCSRLVSTWKLRKL